MALDRAATTVSQCSITPWFETALIASGGQKNGWIQPRRLWKTVVRPRGRFPNFSRAIRDQFGGVRAIWSVCQGFPQSAQTNALIRANSETFAVISVQLVAHRLSGDQKVVSTYWFANSLKVSCIRSCFTPEMNGHLAARRVFGGLAQVRSFRRLPWTNVFQPAQIVRVRLPAARDVH
jgi:hypothetical protein